MVLGTLVSCFLGWRPISLLNTDYKIATKCIAERLKSVISKLINKDQTGFLKDRYIEENIRNVLDIMQNCDENNQDAMLLFLDFEKAYDSIEWPFLIKTMRYFNLSESMIQWVQTFYNQSTSCVINNGYTTKFFDLHRGMRQGCPLSAYLFLLCVEMLAHSIRDNDNIQGLKIDECEHKINQFADDTVLFLKPNVNTLSTVLETLDYYANLSGLKVNIEKSEIITKGVISQEVLAKCKTLSVKCNEDKIRYLGIIIGKDTMKQWNLITKQR